MYLIKAQYKHNKSIVLETVEDKEFLIAMCVNYAFAFGDGWSVWYTKK
jgi:hypothetical protein